MKRYIGLLLFCSLLSTGMQAQDFASRFMMDFLKDSMIRCRTISPRMMSRMMSVPHKKGDEDAFRWIAKLKSARIVTSDHNGKKYFRHAERLLVTNRQRFIPLNQTTAKGNNLIFVRRKDDMIIELVMLNLEPEVQIFTVVNLTGDMDDDFIQSLYRR